LPIGRSDKESFESRFIVTLVDEDRWCPQTQELMRLVGTLIAISSLLLPPLLLASLRRVVQLARDKLEE
jgi:hypothetical protein